MTPAERLVRCPQWRWMPGMRAVQGLGSAPWRLYRVTAGAEALSGQGEDDGGFAADWIAWAKISKAVPDLTDPATDGCLLAMLADAIGPEWRDMMALSRADSHWTICDYVEDGPEYRAPTLGEACALALLALWEAE